MGTGPGSGREAPRVSARESPSVVCLVCVCVSASVHVCVHRQY